MLKTRVLLCEDEADAREILGFYLDTIFDEVVVAQDGQEGLDAYKKSLETGEKFDLVLTDLKMPNLDGMSMLEAIYAIDPKQNFIIVSAYRDEDKLHRSLNLRVLGYFLKPLNVDNIMEMLRKAKDEVLREKENLVEIAPHIRYNLSTQLLYRNGKVIKLSPQETQVLDILIRSRGTIVESDRFKKALWGTTDKADSTFRAIMKRLKDKLEEDDFVRSYKGKGYMVE
jgi:DNA-binding response OmpR family regulator